MAMEPEARIAPPEGNGEPLENMSGDFSHNAHAQIEPTNHKVRKCSGAASNVNGTAIRTSVATAVEQHFTPSPARSLVSKASRIFTRAHAR